MKDSILDAVGSPLVRVSSPEGATVAAKVEGFNPGGSAKDRPAREMVAAAARGYDLTIVMPASKSPERRKLLKAYGADLELVEGEMESARERADRLAAEEGAVQMGQFENPANADAHYRTTAEEIL